MEFEPQDVPSMQRKRLVGALKVAIPLCAALFVLVITIGFGMGKYQSPPYEHATLGPSALMNFVAENGGVEGQGKITKMDISEGRLPDGMNLKFTCGIKTFLFEPATRTTSSRPSTPQETGPEYWGVGMRKQINSLDAALGLLLGSRAVPTNVKETYGSFSRTWRMSNSTTRASMVALAVPATVTGFALGYLAGYDGLPDCGRESLTKLLESADFWLALSSRPNLVAEMLIRSKLPEPTARSQKQYANIEEMLKRNDARVLTDPSLSKPINLDGIKDLELE